MLDKSVQYVRGIGPRRAAVLSEEAGIETIEDLLYYAPRRYLDRSSFKPIGQCAVGETVTVAGTVVHSIVTGRNRRYLEVLIDDGTGVLSGVFFGGIRFLEKNFSPGEEVLFSGKVDFYRNRQIVHPDFDFLDSDSKISSIHTGRIVPLYPSSEKLKGAGFDSRGFRRVIRALIDEFIDHIGEPLPGELIAAQGLGSLRDSLFALHFPESFAAAEAARRRLAFNELFYLQYYLALSRRFLRESERRRARPVDPALVESFIGSHLRPDASDLGQYLRGTQISGRRAWPRSWNRIDRP